VNLCGKRWFTLKWGATERHLKSKTFESSVALAREGAVGARLLVPMIASTPDDSNVLLFKVPFGGPPLYVNHLFRTRGFTTSWPVVTISMLVLFAFKSCASLAASA